MGGCTSKSGKTKSNQQEDDNMLTVREKGRLQELTCKEDVREIYSFGKVVGTGGFAQVKVATSKTDKNQQFAIKIIEKDKLKSKQYIMVREIEILMKLDHPNIIKFNEIYEDSKYFYLVQEFCSGGELLQAIVKKKTFDEYKAFTVIKQIVQAVHHMHTKGIVHRDLKPENILFKTPDENADIKIIDFGLSNRFQAATNLTTMVGTPLYVPPQVLSGNYTQACDVWSIGCIMYVILCGSPPFYSENKNQIFDMIENEDPQFIDPIWSTISIEAQDLIKKMLQKEEKNRITLKDALLHPWFKKMEQHKNHEQYYQQQQQFHPQVLSKLKAFNGYSKFKEQVIKKIINQLNATEIKQLTDVFRAIDQDGTGLVTIQELKQAMINSKVEITNEELDEIFAMLTVDDKMGEKRISYTNFIQATLDISKYLTKEKLWSLFKFFDHSGNNFITEDDLLEIMKRNGNTVTQEEVKQMIDEVDPTHQGKISFEMFKKLMNEDNLTFN